MTDPAMYAIARQVTDEVLGPGTYDRTNGPLFKRLADEGEKRMAENLAAQLRERHKPRMIRKQIKFRIFGEGAEYKDTEVCSDCFQDWPCETEQLIRESEEHADEQLDPVAQFLVWLEDKGYKVAKLAYWAKMPGIEIIPLEQVIEGYNKR